MKRIMIVITLFIAIGIMQTIESTYTRDVVVTKIQDNIITTQDNQGYVWEFYGEGYSKGQAIKLTMSDNHTSNIEDDTIIRVG